MPSQDIGQIIRVHCHDGWTILNPILDSSAISSYFTSWQKYTDTVVGPSFDDFATWRQWLLPANARTQFTTSSDCTQCSNADGEVDQVYHMTGNYYLCAWGTKGDCGLFFWTKKSFCFWTVSLSLFNHTTDMDLDEECYSCVNRHGGNEYLEYMSGTCTHMTMHPDQKVSFTNFADITCSHAL